MAFSGLILLFNAHKEITKISSYIWKFEFFFLLFGFLMESHGSYLNSTVLEPTETRTKEKGFNNARLLLEDYYLKMIY